MTDLTIDEVPIWLINLPSSTERLHAMQAQLDALGLQYRYFAAVNGRQDWETLKETVDIPSFERNVGRRVMPGEIGCYHSHLTVWKELQASGAEVGLVLEDDVIFHDDFRDAVNAALSTVGTWDMVKLNHIRAKLPIKRSDLGRWHLAEYLGAFTGTGAYLITKGAASKLGAQMLPITRPIDHEIDLSYKHKIDHFGLAPFPSHVEDAGQSTITGTNSGGVQKFPKHQRLQVYTGRLKNFLRKALYSFRRR